MQFLNDPKRLLAILVVGIVGLIVLIDFVGVIPSVASVAFVLVDWAATLTALGILVGLASVAATHVRRMVRRDREWGYSAVLLFGMLTVVVVGIVGIPGITVLPQNLAEEPIRRFFEIVYEPLASSLLALLAFFSLSVALRSFQRRSAEAIVIVVVALVVLVLQLPLVATVPYLDQALRWVNDYAALAGARGLLIGVAIGTLVAGVRVFLGFDQPYLDR